jgi:hypothetical protein
MESATTVTIMGSLMSGAVAFTLGYWWAAIVEADRRPARNVAPPPVAIPAKSSVDAGDVKANRREVAKLIRYCTLPGNELPTTVVKSFNEILAVVNRLAERAEMSAKGTATEREQERPVQPSDGTKCFNESGLSVDDVSKLIESVECHGHQREQSRTDSRRYPFRVKKPLFPYQNRLPRKDELNLVECVDVSAGGMALFVENTPDFDTFLISLGDCDCPIIMLGKVVDERASVLNGRVGYRVSARFVRRLDDRYHKLFQDAYCALEKESESPSIGDELQPEQPQAAQT